MKLKSICSPALALMRRMSYGRLFSLVGAVLVAPLAYLLYLQLSSVQRDVTFTEKEEAGVANIDPARELMYQIAVRQMAVAAAASGDTRVADSMTASRVQTNESLSKLIEESNRLASFMTNAAGEQATLGRLKDIQAATQAALVDTGAATESQIRTLRSLRSQLADFVSNYLATYSNLILDPDIDSFWLMDAYTARISELTGTIADTASIALGRSVQGKLDAKSRIELAGVVEATRRSCQLLRTNFDTAFANTKGGAQAALEPMIKSVLGDCESFAALLQSEYLDAEAASALPADIFDMASQVAKASNELHRAVGPQLLSLLDTRLGGHKFLRVEGWLAGGLALLLTLYVLLSFYFQVSSELTGKINEAESLRSKAEAENQSLNNNIMELLTFVANCADGDLTGRAKVTEGALGNVADALNQMMDSWAQVLGTLIKTVEETHTAGRQIGSTAEGMAKGATDQVEKLEGATHAVQQIRGNINHVSENASTASTAASRTQDSAVSGSEMVQKIAEEMETLRSNVQAGAKKIKSLGDRSMEITGIVGTIAKISEQTNMLALNAAIEAARAGEHGRGFSVVAEEVRKLAERTSNATQDIRNLITSIQAETSESVAAIEEQTRAVEHHAESVNQSGQVLQKIQHESTQTSDLITDMNRIAREQVPVAEKTLQNMLSVGEIARETQSSAQATLKLSHVLGETADRLVAAIGSFKIK